MSYKSMFVRIIQVGLLTLLTSSGRSVQIRKTEKDQEFQHDCY